MLSEKIGPPFRARMEIARGCSWKQDEVPQVKERPSENNPKVIPAQGMLDAADWKVRLLGVWEMAFPHMREGILCGCSACKAGCPANGIRPGDLTSVPPHSDEREDAEIPRNPERSREIPHSDHSFLRAVSVFPFSDG
ncbi:hypothetical protein JCM33374_g4317 [Metschnikowia sp. JCM 33374]|nr:hypothetical protein JCM33374_g4317 [Metschnikowia sp. JCM 33374]